MRRLLDRLEDYLIAKKLAASGTHPTGPCSIACQADHWPPYRYTGWSEPHDESKAHQDPDPANYRGLKRS